MPDNTDVPVIVMMILLMDLLVNTVVCQAGRVKVVAGFRNNFSKTAIMTTTIKVAKSIGT